ncbi:MAG TPA: damage-inducible protein DinB [Janthinobacterium sp.]|nr:damage-inducible protein DinB [Janthinobacterium sp.]
MNRSAHLALMADYNQWMNAKLYAAAATLPAEELGADRKAYFGSILGTLNHLVAGDIHWLKRFSFHPAQYAALLPLRALPTPGSLSQALFSDFHSLAQHRQWLDGVIVDWVGTIVESDLDHVLVYGNSKGIVSDKNFFALLTHFFNHQTHHRGQVSTLLSQAGVVVDDTDLLLLIPNLGAA